MLRDDAWDGLRRGGGSENPIVIPLGLMLLSLCFAALIFYRMKQSNIVACIMIGMLFGGTELGDTISRELTAAFIELAIILVLFMGGLEVDVPGFVKRWRLVLLNGLGQIIFTLVFFCVLGFATGLTHEATDTTFFGLACTLSSTILVLGALKDRQESETVHGQVILGLMVLQDVVAVVSLLVLSSFDPHKDHGQSFGVQIAIMCGKFVITLGILFLLGRYVLSWWFKLFAVSGEMLFVGTVGYALGVAGLAGLADFSPEIGGFFAGVSLSAVPYRLEIEHKVEPIKAFGVVLFFFMLGIDLDMDGEALQAALPWSTLLAFLTVFVLPTLMWALGYLSKFTSRTAFMMGLIINQISEFSLILAQLAHKYHVFDDHQFQVITFATVITLLFSSVGHVQADQIYQKCKWMLAILDRRTNEEDPHGHDFELEDHVVLLGFNETGLEIAEFYRHNNQDVLVIQNDPELHAIFKKGYVHPNHRTVINRQSSSASAEMTASAFDSFHLEGWTYSRGRANEGDGWSRGCSQKGSEQHLDSDSTVPVPHEHSGPENLTLSLDMPCTDSRPLLNRNAGSADTSPAGSTDGPASSQLPEPARRSASKSRFMSPVIEAGPGPSPHGASPAQCEDERVPSPITIGDPVCVPGAWLEPPRVLNAVAVCPQLDHQDAVSAAPVEVLAHCRYEASKFSTKARASATAQEKLQAAGDVASPKSTSPKGGSEGGRVSDSFRASSRDTVRRSKSLQQSFRDATKPDRGSRQGMGTNIYSVYADPMSPGSWEHYHLTKAKIVFSCMSHGTEAGKTLSRSLKKEDVPFVAVTNSNFEARDLYEHGCRYVIQQEFLAAKVMKEILDDEIPKGKTAAFDDKRREHKGELHDNLEDDLVRAIHHFLGN